MGRIYQFECAKCGYHARVGGGRERGLFLETQTIHCLDCLELHDAVIAQKIPADAANNVRRWRIKPTPFEPRPKQEKPPTFAAALNRLPPGADRHFYWARYQLLCPVSARHRIRPWQNPGKCPKCGVFLEGSGTAFKSWD